MSIYSSASKSGIGAVGPMIRKKLEHLHRAAVKTFGQKFESLHRRQPAPGLLRPLRSYLIMFLTIVIKKPSLTTSTNTPLRYNVTPLSSYLVILMVVLVKTGIHQRNSKRLFEICIQPLVGTYNLAFPTF